MQWFDFILTFDGVCGLTSRVEDALLKSGCGDAALSGRNDWVFVKLYRQATTIHEAVRKAIRDVREANVGLAFVGVFVPLADFVDSDLAALQQDQAK